MYLICIPTAGGAQKLQDERCGFLASCSVHEHESRSTGLVGALTAHFSRPVLFGPIPPETKSLVCWSTFPLSTRPGEHGVAAGQGWPKATSGAGARLSASLRGRVYSRARFGVEKEKRVPRSGALSGRRSRGGAKRRVGIALKGKMM